MKKLFIGLSIIILLISFIKGAGENMNKALEKEKKILLEKDREISMASAEKGILKAFYPFMNDHSILLPEDGHPVYGREACAKLLNHVEMKGWEGKLKWEPTFANVSKARDLGYTHGRFERPTTDDNGRELITYGYYGTIWEKQPDGEWKVVVSQGLILLKDLNQEPIDKKIDLANVDDITKQVLNTEYAFSNDSVENGIPEAFYRFIDDQGIALSGDGSPRTKETFAKMITAAKKKKNMDGWKNKLEWEPIYSHVSKSEDMAYNYGTYKYTGVDPKGNIQVGYGYFVTVWKRQLDCSWKFVFDGGNQSPPPEDKE
jgi:ketosteroid isomerase-like protein